MATNKDSTVNSNDSIEKKCESKNNPLGVMREWIVKQQWMPQIIMQINATQKLRYHEYLSNEFSQTKFVKNDDSKFALVNTKYPEFVFLQSSNPHNLCLHLWQNKVLNRYMHQTYLIQHVTADINFIATHPLLYGDNKMIKLFGDKRCIHLLGPLIPKSICLTPSEKKCTHILNIVKAYHKYYFGIFDKKYCYGYVATNVKLKCKQFTNTSISRAYYKLREIFLRQHSFFKSLGCNFTALDIGSSPGGWTKYLVDIGADKVVSVDPGELKLDDDTMQSVRYYGKTIEKCITDGDLAQFLSKDNQLDILVCDANIPPIDAVPIIISLCHHLKDNGYIIFTLKMPDRNAQLRNERVLKVQCMLGQLFENIKLIHLLANKGKERTLIATKKKIVLQNVDNMYHFHEIHSF